jgi:hypothetical protein
MTEATTITQAQAEQIAGSIIAGSTLASAEKVLRWLRQNATLGNAASGMIAEALDHQIAIKHDLRAWRAHKNGRRDSGVRKLQTQVGI